MVTSDKKHNTLEQVNNMLAGRTIASVEPGRTRGWILLNFVPIPDDGGDRAFMTLRLDEGTDPHCWSAAIHYGAPNGIAYPLRPFVESK